MSNRTYLSVVTETWPPEINGVAHTCFRLVSGLRQRDDYRIQLVRPRQATDKQAANDGNFEELFVRGLTLPFYREVRFGLPQYFALKQQWRKQRPDMVQIVTEGPLGYAALKAAKALAIPVISDFHTNFDEYSRYYRAGGLFKLAKRYLRYLHNETLVTLVPTKQLQAQLENSGYRRLGILARGIDTRLFNPQRRSDELRTALGIEREQLLVVLVSRLAHEKNLDLAINAFRAIQAEVPDARFMIVGDGPERQRLQSANPDIVFTGMQRGEDLAAHYASGDLFIYPSLSETFGNVITEAMASGLPVVTFNYAAALEHIVSGENGIAVDVTDEAAFIRRSVQLAQDTELRQALGKAAVFTAQTLCWEKVINDLDQVIQSLLTDSHQNKHASATSMPVKPVNSDQEVNAS